MGHHNRHFGGDAHALDGVWSPPTSKANFCEEDYVVTIYIAEFMNSLTNLLYIWFALRYMYGPGSRGLFAPNMDFLSISLLGLGIGSFAFHATLRQAMQFADELSMLGLGWAMLLAVFTVRKPTLMNKLIKGACAIFFPLFAVFYVQTGNILHHATAFFIILVLIVLRCQYIFYYHKESFPRQKMASWTFHGQVAIGILLFGYFLWHADLELCAHLRVMRAHVGYPWALLIEPHGWWHILTAISATMFMNIMRDMQVEMIKIEEREEAEELAAIMAMLQALEAEEQLKQSS